ncbi:MAG: hypothetical protein LBK41_04655 [Clostridiales bacterium]|jgi:hypothetical protein|nr:hypothetical protein [Clostridiales bacterium]
MAKFIQVVTMMGEAALDIVEELKELNARGITYTNIANRSAVNRAHISNGFINVFR